MELFRQREVWLSVKQTWNPFRFLKEERIARLDRLDITAPSDIAVLRKKSDPDQTIIKIPKGYHCQEPISIVIRRQKNKIGVNHLRIIALPKSTALIVILEQDDNGDQSPSFGSQIIDIQCQPESKLTIQSSVRFQSVQDEWIQKNATVESRAKLFLSDVCIGKGIIDNTITVRAKDHSHVNLNIGCVGFQKAISSTRAHVNLSGEEASCLLSMRMALMDCSKSIAHGLIHIERGSSGAKAKQEEHGLILDEGAECDPIPVLAIDHHDVECFHASTVSSIDPDQSFYLASRGIDVRKAEELFILGFLSPVIEKHARRENIFQSLSQIAKQRRHVQ